jgi:hypothetical protein
VNPQAYLPGDPPPPGPLARFLPPIPQGVVTKWLSGSTSAGGSRWVLDPFGAAPRVAVEAARQGYRVLVAANNPVARFLLELLANPPPRKELVAALAALGAARKGEERLEPHIRALYLTQCANCGEEIEAEMFLWERNHSAPYARVYRCPHCKDSGEHPADEADVARALQFTPNSLHHARALERVAGRDDPDRGNVEEALETYLPRAVYAIFTLLNRLDSLTVPPVRRRYLQALLLSACDQGNTLWPQPPARARPRQLTSPPRFREHNIWKELEKAIDLWAAPSEEGLPPLPVTIWPALPPETGGLCLFEGRLRDLGRAGQTDPLQAVAGLAIEAVLAPLPRPNQAYWTLSALWAGWLWGKDAVGPFKSVLRRRRYDWSWHTTALHTAFEAFPELTSPGAACLGLMGEAEPGFISAALIAAGLAGLELESLAVRPESDQAQIIWRIPPPGARPPASPPEQPIRDPDLARRAARAYLKQRGEPAGYLHLHSAALSALVETERLLTLPPGEDGGPLSPSEILNRINLSLEEAFSWRGGFIRYGGSEKSLEVGQWWLRDPEAVETPLSDRVEMALVRTLLKSPGLPLSELDAALCAEFPGLLTPNPELLQVCLESYSEEDPPESGRWRLRPQDLPKARRDDLTEIGVLLDQIARQLGYQAEGEDPLLWLDSQGRTAVVIHLLASAVVGQVLLSPPPPAPQRWIVIPGGRANLLAYKLAGDPRLKQAAERWRFIKYRQVRYLAESPLLSLDFLDEQLSLDPLTYAAPQMRML